MMLDDDEEYAGERDALLERFRQSLGLPISERYFDEDDLIEIFDYAGDLGDDYLRMEALMCGARYFPDSEELLERRAIFYSQYSPEVSALFFDDNSPKGDLILELLSLRQNPPQGEAADSALDDLLSRYDKLSDEEVIQLVDVASAIGRFEWLRANIGRLKKKAQFATIVLYEVGMAADNAKDYAYAASLLEELTEAEPFNSYYWMQLARQYAEFDSEKALSAIEYSLAINPKAAMSMVVKAHIIYSMDADKSDECLALLSKANDIEPGNIDCLRLMSMICNDSGQPERALRVLREALKTATPEQQLDIIPEMLQYNPEEAPELFQLYYQANEDKSQIFWATWAQHLAMDGYSHLARMAVECYERNTGIVIPSQFPAEDAFVDGRFAESEQLLRDYIRSLGGTEADYPTLMAMHLVALAKSGMRTKAETLCQYVLSHIDISRYPMVTKRVEYLGLLSVIRDIMHRLGAGQDFSDYDPFGLWSE